MSALPFSNLPNPHRMEWKRDEETGVLITDRFTIIDATEWIAEVHFAMPAPGVIMPFFHLEVWLLTPSILRQMLATWAAFRKANPQMLFTHADADSAALDRLRDKFGFKLVLDESHSDFTDKKVRKLYAHKPAVLQ